MTYKPRMYVEMEKKWRDRRVIGENIDIGSFRPKEWPVGSIYVPILGKVFEGEKK
jgi:hypothetical protein